MQADQLIPQIPAAVAAVVVVGYLLLQWAKRRDAADNDEWARMRHLLEEVRGLADQYRRRAERAEAERDAYRARYGPLTGDEP